MKSLRISLLISFVIHFMIFTVFYLFEQDQTPAPDQLQINITSSAATSQPKIESPDQIQTDVLPKKFMDTYADRKVYLFPFDFHLLLDSLYDPTPSLSDTSAFLNQKDWEQFLSNKWKEEYFLSEINLPTKNDSHLTLFSMKDIFQTEHDDIGGFNGKTTYGVQPLLFLEKIVTFLKQQLDKKNPPQFNFIPSETQLNIISILSNKENATQLEIYSLLSPERSVTTEILNQDLDRLTNKGFLTRENISPQLIFDFFGTPIEMSRKNQLNPVYLYKLNIDKQELLFYLQSRLFLLREELQTNPHDSSVITLKINTLQQQIFSLLHE